MNHLINYIIRWRVFCLISVAVITFLAFGQLSKLQVDNSNESFFHNSDDTRLRLETFKQTFGNDDFIFILLDNKQPVTSDTLKRVDQLVEELKRQVPYLSGITWIGNVETINGEQDGISIEPLIPDYQQSPEQMSRLLDQITNDPYYRDRLISPHGNVLGILIEFENYPEAGLNPRKESPPIVESIVANYQDLSPHIVGAPVMSYRVDADTEQEGPIWMAIALTGMVVLLAFITRSFIGVIVPITTVFLAIIWTLALVALFGFRLNLLTIMVPTLLLCVGIGDTMHVVADFRQHYLKGQSAPDALRSTLKIISKPLILTTVTTVAGYMAFIFTDLVPLQELGIQAAIGATIALVLTYFYAIPLLSFTRVKAARPSDKAKTDISSRFLSLTCKAVLTYPKTILGLFTAAILVSAFGMSQLKIETALIHDLPESDPLRQSFEFVDDNMGGSMSMEFILNTGEIDGVKDPAVIMDIERLQEFLNGHPLIIQTSSFLDQLKQINRALHMNRPEYYALPDSKEKIAEYLFLYEAGGGKLLDQFVSFSYDTARIQARTRALKLGDIKTLEADVNQFVSNTMPDRKIEATGTLSLFSAVADYLAIGQAFSFLYAFVAIAIVMSLALRSVKLGVLAMVPNVLPVFFALGLMGITGAEINMIMVTLAPLILGVSVDDTIHFFTRYQQHFAQHKNYRQAYLHTIATVGRVLLFTTIIISAGFLGFSYSKYDGPFVFAFISVFAYSTALFSDLLLTPLLFSIFKPLGPGIPDQVDGKTDRALESLAFISSTRLQQE